MDKSDVVATKSSNEILSELFGAFNAEPPEIIDKPKSYSEADDSDHSKKSKKSKRKKSKKKHKSKSKKHKRKHSNGEDCLESELSSSKMKKKKKKKDRDKEKKIKKTKQAASPNSVNIELSVNEVPMALEIMLDGTVGIKGEDGVITKIPDIDEEEKDSKEANANVLENGDEEHSADKEDQLEKAVDTEKTEEKKSVNPIKVQEVFEAEPIEQTDKQKKGKIQIRNLKFSSVFQETVKAVEEKQKKEQERKADIEEGELSESSESDLPMECDDPELGDKNKRKTDGAILRYHNHSELNYENEDLRIHIKKISSRSRHRSPSGSRSRSVTPFRSRSRHHSRSRYHSREKSSYKRHRSRSRSKDYYPLYYSGNAHRKRSRKTSPSSKKSHHSRSRDRHRSRSRSRSRSHSHSHSHSRSRRSREKRSKMESSHRSDSNNRSKTNSKERSESVEKIDKEKLLAIARKNALKLIDAGVVPGSEKLTTIKAGGKTVNELTEYCKKLSKKESLGKDVSDVESESSDDGDKPFHHPFQVRDRPNSIIMNIKNSIPLPVKSLQEKAAEQSKQLRLQFPVSSGSSHRRNESEWIPVSPKKEEVPEKQVPVQETAPAPVAFVAPLPVDSTPLVRMPPPQPIMPPMPDFTAVYPPEVYNRPVFPVIQPNPPAPKVDISTIVSKRLEAMRKLQENPNDSQALNEMYSAQQEMQYWAESKQDLGAFTGTTGAKILSVNELSSGAHAWAKRAASTRAIRCVHGLEGVDVPRIYSMDNLSGLDQLTAATPVKGGMGMALLQKMGWQPGEGLGKNKEGTLEPLRLEVKMDKKGLVASDESKKAKKLPVAQQSSALPTVKTLEGKHPVSLLNEFCSRRRYGVPQFELCFECGPDHKKNFLFKVKVNGIEYTPTVASPNKKQAKAEAAAICLKALGVISTTT